MAAKKKEMAKPEQFEGVTLMRLRTENVKRVRLIDVTFHDGVNTIGGDNAAGKSSYLDSYKFVIAGAGEIDAQPIHNGQQVATITADFGDGKEVKLTATRTIKRVGTDEYTTDIDLEIHGYITPSAVQTFLDKLAGEASFDPMAFDRLTDADRLEKMRAFVVGFDFKTNARKRKEAFEKRTKVKQDMNRAQSAADAIVVADVAPVEFVDEAALTVELTQAGNHNTSLEQRRSKRQEAVTKVTKLRADGNSAREKSDTDVQAETRRSSQDVQTWQDEIAAIQKKIANEQDRLAAAVKVIRDDAEKAVQLLIDEADALQAKLDGAEELPPAKDAEAIAAKLSAARDSNKLLADWTAQRDRRNEYQAEADKYSTEADELTATIVEFDGAKEDAIRKAHLPIDGLGFGDEFITLNQLPWSQASMAERIDASTAIAMAMNPKLKVILIRDGSNLGSKIRERIAERASAKGYRVLMEIVDENGANSHVFIEDGMIKQVESAAA